MKLINALILMTIAGGATAFSLSMTASPQQASSSLDRRSFVATGVASAVAASGFAAPAMAEDADPYADFVTTESGMKYKVTKEGDGAIPSPGQTVKAHYTGWLDGFDSIRKFDSSRDRGRPFTFKVGGKFSLQRL